MNFVHHDSKRIIFLYYDSKRIVFFLLPNKKIVSLMRKSFWGENSIKIGLLLPEIKLFTILIYIL